MAPHHPVLVIGGTRGTGLLIARLLNEREIPVRVLARDEARAQHLFEKTVEIVGGDITRPETLAPAIEGSRHIVFTAGCRSGYPARERTVRATEYQGVLNTLDTTRRIAFAGRFLYMTSSGVTTPSFSTFGLNLWKGNTLLWRRRAEAEIRGSGLDYTIIRAGFLLSRPGGQHEITITQIPLPLSLRYRIARADVAQVFLAALDHPRASRATFETVWGSRSTPGSITRLLDSLIPDGRDSLNGSPW
jgi:uncharacterized protein YbjT (DUF2867 family)